MLNADRDSSCRSRYYGAFGAVSALASAIVMICSGCQSMNGGGFADQSKTQLQFYAPPGASVEVMSGSGSQQIPPTGPFEDRLERSPEECSVFNLSPGRYEFKYVSADGLPGISVYGELEVYYANRHAARVFQRRSFVPISLPSEYYRRVGSEDKGLFPFRSQADSSAIDDYDLQRLKQGDVIEKVFFVADLKKANERLDRVDREIAVHERKLEWAEARFREAYFSFRSDVADPLANLLRRDRAFIKWEDERQELQQDLDKLIALRERTRSLLNGDHVLIRRGMLVLATQEVVEPHEDVVEAADELGEILLVMRVGGRHMHWGDPQNELASYEH